MNNENKGRASYEAPSIQIVFFETEDVLTESSVQGGFWGEEDSFKSDTINLF